MGIGQVPYGVNRGGQTDGRRILRSRRENAIIKSIQIPGGFGIVPSGQVMGIITESTNRVGQYVPRVPKTPSAGVTNAVGITYVTATPSTYYAYVTMEDSYRFAVGDHIAIADSAANDSTAEDLGAITAIDRTTYTHVAMITFTNSVSATFTVAQGAFIWIQTLTTYEFFKAQGILLGAVDTGKGEDAKGGQGALVVGNAEFYESGLYQYDSDAQTDLSSTDLGDTIYLK